MTASQAELIPLIYWHLKEHGFHTAAEELHKHSLQSEAPPSTSLVDIYTSWLKSSKRKTKSARSKESTSDKKQTTSKKAAPARKKKSDKKTKQPVSPSKKSSAKQKKSDGKGAEKNFKSSRSQSKNKSNNTVEDDSDSDSSLDVEKWKKLVLKMTDADHAKADAFAALAKKPRVRKPQAKPKPKAETSTNAQDQNSNITVKSGVLPESNASKKSCHKKVSPVVAMNGSSQEQNVETPALNVSMTPKQSPSKAKRKSSTKKTPLEPKEKKKKHVSSNVIAGATDGNCPIDKISDKIENAKTSTINEVQLKSQEDGPKSRKDAQIKAGGNDSGAASVKNVPHLETETSKEITPSENNTDNVEAEVKKKKKTIEVEIEKITEGNLMVGPDVEENTAEDLNVTQVTEELTVESVASVKKKKKKKEKSKGKDGDEHAATEAMTNSVTTDETVQKPADNLTENRENNAPKKKKKKKDKSREESETLLQESVTVEGVCVEENTQENVVKKKSKKKKKDGHKHLETEEEPVDTITNPNPLEEISDPPSTLQTPTLKKKKNTSCKLRHLFKQNLHPRYKKASLPKRKRRSLPSVKA